MSLFVVSVSVEAQKKYCEDNHYPHFAPKDGRCWNCKQNIYLPGKHYWKGKFDGRDSQGISTEKASTELVTGCPHCCRSYCD